MSGIGAAERTIAAPEALSVPVPAPSIGGILANPADMGTREADLFFAVRDKYNNGPDLEANHNTLVVAVSEAEALRDFDDRMAAAGDLLCTYGRREENWDWTEFADHIRGGLRFIGRQELDASTEAIARYWIDKLDASQSGELFVALEAHSSPAFIYQAVMQALERLNPDAAACIFPTWIDSPAVPSRLRSRVEKAGVVILDDWVISGDQAKRRIDQFLSSDLVPDVMEVNLVAAKRVHLEKGLRGVACKAYFEYPQEDYTITGAHGDTDYGFRNPINSLFYRLRSLVAIQDGKLGREECARLPLPLLCRVARVYRDCLGTLQMSAEAAAAYKDRRASYGSAAANIGSMHRLATSQERWT